MQSTDLSTNSESADPTTCKHMSDNSAHNNPTACILLRTHSTQADFYFKRFNFAGRTISTVIRVHPDVFVS